MMRIRIRIGSTSREGRGLDFEATWGLQTNTMLD